MKNELFKVGGVAAPVETRDLPTIWIVNVCGESKGGRYVAVALEFDRRVLADATLFGISKLMDKTDLWFSVPPSKRKGHPMVNRMRYLIRVSRRFVRSSDFLDRRHYTRRAYEIDCRREGDDDRRVTPWIAGRRLSNSEYKRVWA